MTLIILLFTLGLLLLAAEVMIPGGILGIVGGVSLFTGCIVSFVILGPTEGMIAIAITILAAITLFYVQFKILPNTKFGRRFFLDDEISATSSAIGSEARDLIGKDAESITVLSPSGYVMVGGKRYEAVSQSGQIPQGTILEIVSVNSFQLIVRTRT
ncbi:NfeD family protein [Akkermansiaceae bacterium]|nr:NfeD family protein [Akkermansiaceae bacterium]